MLAGAVRRRVAAATLLSLLILVFGAGARYPEKVDSALRNWGLEGSWVAGTNRAVRDLVQNTLKAPIFAEWTMDAPAGEYDPPNNRAMLSLRLWEETGSNVPGKTKLSAAHFERNCGGAGECRNLVLDITCGGTGDCIIYEPRIVDIGPTTGGDEGTIGPAGRLAYSTHTVDPASGNTSDDGFTVGSDDTITVTSLTDNEWRALGQNQILAFPGCTPTGAPSAAGAVGDTRFVADINDPYITAASGQVITFGAAVNTAWKGMLMVFPQLTVSRLRADQMASGFNCNHVLNPGGYGPQSGGTASRCYWKGFYVVGAGTPDGLGANQIEYQWIGQGSARNIVDFLPAYFTSPGDLDPNNCYLDPLCSTGTAPAAGYPMGPVGLKAEFVPAAHIQRVDRSASTIQLAGQLDGDLLTFEDVTHSCDGAETDDWVLVHYGPSWSPHLLGKTISKDHMGQYGDGRLYLYNSQGLVPLKEGFHFGNVGQGPGRLWDVSVDSNPTNILYEIAGPVHVFEGNESAGRFLMSRIGVSQQRYMELEAYSGETSSATPFALFPWTHLGRDGILATRASDGAPGVIDDGGTTGDFTDDTVRPFAAQGDHVLELGESGTSPGCLVLRDNDDAGWTEIEVLNGAFVRNADTNNSRDCDGT